MSDTLFRLAVADIDRAIELGEFRLVFQPKIDLATRRMTGAEAFIRWQHPKYGLLPPGLFLEFVEAAGRIEAVTRFVFDDALAAAAAWRIQGHNWGISVNVAPGTVTSPDFVPDLARQLDACRLPPGALTIEVPERAIAQEPDQICEALGAIRTLGVKIALDGGGIVPVDLHAFNPMPFTAVKVSGPASIRLAQRLGPHGRGALANRLRQAMHFGLEIVAVGAEDEVTMGGLSDVGFTAAQGIWIQKPLPSAELLAWDGHWACGRGIASQPVPLVALKPRPEPAAGTTPEHAMQSLKSRYAARRQTGLQSGPA